MEESITDLADNENYDEEEPCSNNKVADSSSADNSSDSESRRLVYIESHLSHFLDTNID
jgi:hypothetical protein